MTTLFCFAVKQEAKPFQRLTGKQRPRILLTGMGPANAERALTAELLRERPGLVVSCGFAGGLDPELEPETVVFTTQQPELSEVLRKSGARPGRFHFAERVATTARQKRLLREQSGADAVEMESAIIARHCNQHRISNAIVRVILDTATEDLPLDFNVLMNARQELAPGKLTSALLKQPQKVLGLLRLQRRSTAAARALAQVLIRVVEFAANANS